MRIRAKIVEVMAQKHKPEGTATRIGRRGGNWCNRLGALPEREVVLIAENSPRPGRRGTTQGAAAGGIEPGLKPEMLFMLGLSDFKLASGGNADKAQESANYFRACAAIKSPYQRPPQPI